MRAPTFKSKGEIEEVAVAVAVLMRSWGLKPSQWMAGKYVSHVFMGMTKPKDAIRDINLYVLKDALPWNVKNKIRSRSLIPPAGPYFDAYNKLQNTHHVSVDVMPLPDEYLGASFISRNREEMEIRGERINLESAEKFIRRLEVLTGEFKGKTGQEFRDFYYADKKRYQDRLDFYNGVVSFLKRKKQPGLAARMQKVTDDYTLFMRRAYPELFGRQRGIAPRAYEAKGSSVNQGVKKITGVVKVYNAKSPFPKSKEKFVYVFPHFFPGDTRVFPHAKAIVTDGGGLLSHAAIVCREIGMPCIVGAKDASRAFKDGDRVMADLKKGVVRKIG